MNFIEFLQQEWVPALGCTEPASIAYAGLNAASQLSRSVTRAKVTIDPRIYKNCYSVGIPHSGHKTGIKWATAVGCFLKKEEQRTKNKEQGTNNPLECFSGITENTLSCAKKLIDSDRIEIAVDRSKGSLFINFETTDGKDNSDCLIEGTHTNITLISKNGKAVFNNESNPSAGAQNKARKWASTLDITEIINIAENLDFTSRKKIRGGLDLNMKIARHGLTLFPKHFIEMTSSDPLTRIASHVCAGVYARMWGEDFPVMSVAGSGNKGITTAVPLNMLEKEWKIASHKIEEAMAMAIMVTSKTTQELGTLSAVCGCSNAAGIGVACALAYLQGGGEKEIGFAINNMVGNVTGMICDGAKIGCALKTMTAVDAAFRAAALAINGIGIPKDDGIVGQNGAESLVNMGKIANEGMIQTDEEILKIMEKKLSRGQ